MEEKSRKPDGPRPKCESYSRTFLCHAYTCAELIIFPAKTNTPANEMHLGMLSNWYHLLSTLPLSDNAATFATLHVGSATTVPGCAFEQGHVSVSQRRACKHHPVRVESRGRNWRGAVRRQHIRVQEITEGLYRGQGFGDARAFLIAIGSGQIVGGEQAYCVV